MELDITLKLRLSCAVYNRSEQCWKWYDPTYGYIPVPEKYLPYLNGKMEANMYREKFKVVTLCGSTKFKDKFIEIAEKLTLEGKIVISLGLFGHADNKFGTVITEEIKQMLDEAHKAKIEISDEIFVINPGGYIGNSTRSEIMYAKKLGKIVNYLEGDGKYE